MVICYLLIREALAWAVPTGTRSFCHVFRGMLAACCLEMNRPFPESRRTNLSGFLAILFSFRFDRPGGRIVGISVRRFLIPYYRTPSCPDEVEEARRAASE